MNYSSNVPYNNTMLSKSKNTQLIHWQSISEADIQRIIDENDIGVLETYLPIILNANISYKEFNSVTKENLAKLLQLSQLSLEYFTYTHEYLDNLNLKLSEEFKTVDKESKDLEHEYQKKIAKYKKKKEKLKNKKKKILKYKTTLEENHTFKCHLCANKFFISEAHLDSHVRKKHPEQFFNNFLLAQQTKMFNYENLATIPKTNENLVNNEEKNNLKIDEIKTMMEKALEDQKKALDQENEKLKEKIDNLKEIKDIIEKKENFDKNIEKENIKMFENLNTKIESLSKTLAEKEKTIKEPLSASKSVEMQKLNEKLQKAEEKIRQKELELEKEKEYQKNFSNILTQNLTNQKLEYYSGVLESDHDSEKQSPIEIIVDRKDEMRFEGTPEKIEKSKEVKDDLLRDDYEKKKEDLIEMENKFKKLIKNKGKTQNDKVIHKNVLESKIKNELKKEEKVSIEDLYEFDVEKCEKLLINLQTKFGSKKTDFSKVNEKSMKKEVIEEESKYDESPPKFFYDKMSINTSKNTLPLSVHNSVVVNQNDFRKKGVIGETEISQEDNTNIFGLNK